MDYRDDRAIIPRKLVEATFRNLWLLLLPMILLPVAVVFLTRSEPTYHSGATIWTQTNEDLNSGPLDDNLNPYQTPAQNRVQVLQDLLSTKSFLLDIAFAAKIVDPSASEKELTKAAIYVGDSINVAAIGTNLVGLAVATSNANDAYAIAVSFINAYTARAQEESKGDSEIRIAYYTEQITIAQAKLDTQTAEISTFVAANPLVVDATSKVYNVQYENMKIAYDQQAKTVQELRTKLFESELDAQTAIGAQSAVFKVQDVPQLATEPDAVSVTKKLGLPVAAFLFGTFLSAAFLYVVYRLDQTIRTSDDIESLKVPLLGYVPEIQKGPGAGAWQYTPFGWFMQQRQKGYARKVAASIASIPVQGGRA